MGRHRCSVNLNEALQRVEKYRAYAGFSGVMHGDAGTIDANAMDGCTYSQQTSSILKHGKTC